MSSNANGSVPFEPEGVGGFLHRPHASADRGLVLTHRAGGDCNASIRLAVAAPAPPFMLFGRERRNRV
jgi:hypothetical protein